MVTSTTVWVLVLLMWNGATMDQQPIGEFPSFETCVEFKEAAPPSPPALLLQLVCWPVSRVVIPTWLPRPIYTDDEDAQPWVGEEAPLPPPAL
jgi:hypothetical protein